MNQSHRDVYLTINGNPSEVHRKFRFGTYWNAFDVFAANLFINFNRFIELSPLTTGRRKGSFSLAS